MSRCTFYVSHLYAPRNVWRAVLSARAYLQRFLEVSKHTAASLWMGIRIERQLGDKDAIASYKLALRNNFPDSNEATLLEAENK